MQKYNHNPETTLVLNKVFLKNLEQKYVDGNIVKIITICLDRIDEISIKDWVKRNAIQVGNTANMSKITAQASDGEFEVIVRIIADKETEYIDVNGKAISFENLKPGSTISLIIGKGQHFVRQLYNSSATGIMPSILETVNVIKNNKGE